MAKVPLMVLGVLWRDVHAAALAKNIVIKNIDDFFDVASETSTKINVLKCSKKQVQASVTQIDNDTVVISAIPTTQKMHSLKVLSFCCWNKGTLL